MDKLLVALLSAGVGVLLFFVIWWANKRGEEAEERDYELTRSDLLSDDALSKLDDVLK